MKRSFICLVILLSAVGRVDARTAELTLHTATASEPGRKYRLLPKTDELTDADAVPLYEKAIESLAEKLNTSQINQWRKIPLDELPYEQVRATLRQFKPTLRLLQQAAKCRHCDWTYDAVYQKLDKYRNLAFFLSLQMRYQVAQGRYDSAIDTVQTGFALAKNLSKESSLIPGLAAVAVTAVMCQQIEQFIQMPDAPNLYQALRDLPQPFIDLTEQAEWEDADIKEKVHLLMNRLDRHLAALQCIEAIRLYTADSGKFPARLSDVTWALLPNDPVTDKPFVYNCTGPNAVLEMAPLKGATDKDVIRYELTLGE